jgi:hypothetical protein
MTVTVKDIRVRISPDMIDSYVSKKGIDTVFKPYDLSQNIYDVRFQTSDKSSVPLERCFKEDVEKEIEKFKVIGDRIRDSPLYVKSFDKQKVVFAFECNEDDHALDSIDDVRKTSKTMNVEKEVPKGEKQIRWYDKSW